MRTKIKNQTRQKLLTDNGRSNGAYSVSRSLYRLSAPLVGQVLLKFFLIGIPVVGESGLFEEVDVGVHTLQRSFNFAHMLMALSVEDLGFVEEVIVAPSVDDRGGGGEALIFEESVEFSREQAERAVEKDNAEVFGVAVRGKGALYIFVDERVRVRIDFLSDESESAFSVSGGGAAGGVCNVLIEIVD